MNQNETKAILSILSSVWPNHPITDDTVTAWSWAFEDVPAPVAEDAVKQWMRSGKPFFPTPSDLRKLAAIDRVASELVPEAAWAEVLSEVRRVGSGRLTLFQNGVHRPIGGPAFSHPLIKAAVDATGWEYIRTSDKPGIVKSQFTHTLDAMMAAEVSRVQNGDLSTPLPVDAGTTTNVRAIREGRSA